MERINCESLIVDPKNAELVLEYLPDGETIDGLCGLFSALGDGTRLKILSALSITALCVGDIVKLLGLNQTTVSHQLAALRIAGAVKCRRQGKVSFYSLADRRILDVMLSATEFTARG